MHHPIQMKPADSENRNGKCTSLYIFFPFFRMPVTPVFSFKPKVYVILFKTVSCINENVKNAFVVYPKYVCLP